MMKFKRHAQTIKYRLLLHRTNMVSDKNITHRQSAQKQTTAKITHQPSDVSVHTFKQRKHCKLFVRQSNRLERPKEEKIDNVAKKVTRKIGIYYIRKNR
ncbi:hypothetical protein Mapa_011116 [Marchantia paleacea]|nr:hypothetical protein Mapa_011116 [Marchantia paleacea]